MRAQERRRLMRSLFNRYNYRGLGKNLTEYQTQDGRGNILPPPPVSYLLPYDLPHFLYKVLSPDFANFLFEAVFSFGRGGGERETVEV